MPSRRGAYAKKILKKYLREAGQHEIFKPLESGARISTPAKIGIVGAGIAGLYTALMLDWLDDPDFTYDILEANPDRVGGRLYTHHFDKKKKYEYYDVGAMRFPDLPWMKPTTDLMSFLHVPCITYIMEDEKKNNISFFNGKALSAQQIKTATEDGLYDVFGTGLPLTKSNDDMFKSAFGPFKEKLCSKDPAVWKQGLEELIQYDDWSTREFMRCRPDIKEDISLERLTQQVISYLETVGTSTGNYDQAFVESVLDSVDFDTDGTKWVCVDGGAELIAETAHRQLKQTVQLGKRVTAISPYIPEGQSQIEGVRLTINNNEHTDYDHVISTMSLGCLSIVDMSKCNLDWYTQWPIRQLRYDSSVKIAIRFSKRWWETHSQPQVGGVSCTDRPTRVVVYPSYGLHGSAATMIVSYTWSQDALRLGAGVNGTTLSKELLDVILKDLADMHDIKHTDGTRDYTFLPKLMIEHHAWDWYKDPFSMGAFALFGPAQFTQLYRQLTRPAFGKLHFAGEATSVHHAWVVGALYSAFRCLVEVFQACGRQDLIDRLRAPGSPFASAGAEDSEVSDDLVGLQIAMGEDHGRKLAEIMLAQSSTAD
ncbi:unnamed protein product [Rhizoctonia solani]|uniref:Amine oxidase domain-containing protein n=1 Tax=Rhizoctonia solani TaxID=456999 RepID=A0A8H3CDA7_9AGAM|nr:unnamed protein product [Rhizoctonia solani]